MNSFAYPQSRCLLAFVAFLVCFSASAATFNVRDYGAKGDGVTKDTAAIQKAIDAASAAGGGRVLLEGGTFLSGSLWLKSHVDFHIEQGARLFGSDSLDDYNALDAYPQNGCIAKREGWQYKHLIICLEQENVSLTGNGVIDGNGRAYFDTVERSRGDINWRFGGINAKDFANCVRPGQVVQFIESRNIRIRDLRFVDSTAWTCHLHGCENVQIRGINVDNDYRHMNTDGIDIDCCRNVTVSDCVFVTGDDAITLRGVKSKMKDQTRACENIVIENCSARVSACGMRIGVGTGTIRHVTVNNFIVYQGEQGIWVCSQYAARGGTEISDIQFNNVSIRNTPYAVWVEGSAGFRPRNLFFNNVVIYEDDIVPDRPDVHLKNCDGVFFNSSYIVNKEGVARPFDIAKDVSDLPHVRRPPNPALR